MADASYQDAKALAWGALMRQQKLLLVRAVLAGQAAGLSETALCDLAQDVLDQTHETFNRDLARLTRQIAEPRAPVPLQ